MTLREAIREYVSQLENDLAELKYDIDLLQLYVDMEEEKQQMIGKCQILENIILDLYSMLGRRYDQE